jgi:hypothetical protein
MNALGSTWALVVFHIAQEENWRVEPEKLWVR